MSKPLNERCKSPSCIPHQHFYQWIRAEKRNIFWGLEAPAQHWAVPQHWHEAHAGLVAEMISSFSGNVSLQNASKLVLADAAGCEQANNIALMCTNGLWKLACCTLQEQIGHSPEVMEGVKWLIPLSLHPHLHTDCEEILGGAIIATVGCENIDIWAVCLRCPCLASKHMVCCAAPVHKR